MVKHTLMGIRAVQICQTLQQLQRLDNNTNMIAE